MRLCKAQNTVSQFWPVIGFAVLNITKYCAESLCGPLTGWGEDNIWWNSPLRTFWGSQVDKYHFIPGDYLLKRTNIDEKGWHSPRASASKFFSSSYIVICCAQEQRRPCCGGAQTLPLGLWHLQGRPSFLHYDHRLRYLLDARGLCRMKTANFTYNFYWFRAVILYLSYTAEYRSE